ncbi:hypothetical protein ACA910_018820 [Epithemia clementina (nom. ined.)]
MAAADLDADRGRCMIAAFICCYHAWDCNNPLLLCKGAGDCLCIRHSCCMAINTPDKGCGMTTDKERGECCKIGCFCCDVGLILPTKLCGCAEQCLCCYSVANFPCSNEYIPTAVCTCLLPGLACCPRCGCCIAPPPCPALDKVLNDEPMPLMAEVMNREEQPATPVPGTKTVTETVQADGTKIIKESIVNPDGSMTVKETIESAA